mgnify:CR=1 FL=1
MRKIERNLIPCLSRILIGDRQVDPIEQMGRIVWLVERRLLTLATDSVHSSKAKLLRRFLRLQMLNRRCWMTSGHA